MPDIEKLVENHLGHRPEWLKEPVADKPAGTEEPVAAQQQQGGEAEPAQGTNNDGQENNAPEQQTAPPATTPPIDTPPAPEIDDEKVLKYLRDKGLKVDSLEAIGKEPVVVSDEEKEAAKKAKRDQSISYAISEKIFDSTQLQSYNVDAAKNAEEIGYNVFAAEQRQMDANVTDEEIRERFEHAYGLNMEEGDWKRKNGEQALERLKLAYLNHNYGNIINAESHYDNYISQKNNVEGYAAKVEQSFTALDKTYTYELKDKDNFDAEPFKFNFKFDEAKLNELKKEFLSEHALKVAAQGETDATELGRSINVALMNRFMKEIVQEVAYAYNSEKMLALQMNRQGVQPNNEGGSGQVPKRDAPDYAGLERMAQQVTGKKVVLS